jgi:hypothetical protein
MTESPDPGHPPVGHVIFRVLLASLVISLMVAALLLVVLHRAGGLAMGRILWDSVKRWALPW